MIDDETYERCRPILDNDELDEEDRTEKLQELLRDDFPSASVEGAVLDVLWRHRNGKASDYPTPFRGTILRKSSPAPWQINRTPTPLASPPLGSSPGLQFAYPVSRPTFSRQLSNSQSPFASPRPSPRLALAQPIPHSPNLNAYEFSEQGSTPDIYGDYGSDNVDWLVADETASNASSTGTGVLSAAAPEWQPQPDMSPHDILRSVLGDKKSNEEIEEALEKSSYDLGQTIALLTGADSMDPHLISDVPLRSDGAILIGKSMHSDPARSITPNSGRSPIICKYWLASGSCLRADCRFAHDTSTHLCKYWLAGNCLAGDSCQFSHDPSASMSNLNIEENQSGQDSSPPAFQLRDHALQFPSLQSQGSRSSAFAPAAEVPFPTFIPMSQQRGRGAHQNYVSNSRPQSRPDSRHQHRPDLSSSLSVDDPDNFPTLASLNAKRSSKHHGPRSRHGHSNFDKDSPSSLADVVRMSPSPAPAHRKLEPARKVRASGASESTASSRIPDPQHIPWLETGEKANQQYLKYRQEAIKHGSIRNKFLQSAAQAWNRNDARAAKALSLRGQAENDAMRKAHREAAKALYDERNNHLIKGSGSQNIENEIYVDLHGLHPEEAIEYLENILISEAKTGRRVLFAITGTGHHSKNGKDKVGKGVRNWLHEWGYVFREFSVPGERGGYIGGVLGIDVTSHRAQPRESKEDNLALKIGGKIQVLKREEIVV